MQGADDYIDLGRLNPVFIDLETRSCCDLPRAGGFNYAKDPTTRLLTVSWSDEPDVYHVWFPNHGDDFDPKYQAAHLPTETIHYGNDLPAALLALAQSGRPWVAHNAWTFDEPVWSEMTDLPPKGGWLDTYPLALAAGLPGGLGHIGERLWGEGKYDEGKSELKKHTCPKDKRLADPRNVPATSQLMIGRYNVQDVRLMRWLWDELVRTLRMPEDEWRVMLAHRVVNARGVRTDERMLTALINLTNDCQSVALLKIRELTKDCKTPLTELTHLRSRTRIFQWLDEMGVKLGSSLRKEIVREWIDAVDTDSRDKAAGEFGPEIEDDSTAVETKNIALVAQVLKLRMSALRVTSGKLQAGLQSVSDDGRIRGLYAYWGAHTGRDAHRRMQVGNLPIPKPGIDVWALTGLYEKTGKLDYDTVCGMLPIGDPRFPWLTPDDAASTLIRSVFSGPLGVADLSTIEARVIAWLAGEQWLLDAFKNDVDAYLAFGAKVVGPLDTWPDLGQKSMKKHPWRQVFKIGLLSSLYGSGPSSIAMQGAAMGIDWETSPISPEEVTVGFRSSHPAIAGLRAGEYNGVPYFRGGFWDQLNAASVAAVRDLGVPVRVGRLVFEKIGPHLYVTLPSGRNLCYRHASYVQRPFFSRMVDSVRFASARYGWVDMYGGKWAENVTQAVARDFMFNSMVLMEDAGLPVVLRVHDELGAEIRPDQYELFMSLMTTRPSWAPDFTLDAEGGLLPRYAKSAPPDVKEQVWRNGKYHKPA